MVVFPGTLPGVKADDAAPESDVLLTSIPPLDRWNDPFAISMKDHLSGKSPSAAGDLLIEELIKVAEELTGLAKAMKPDYSSYSSQMVSLAKAQLKVRVLMESLHFSASQLPTDQQAAWKAAARNRFISALTTANIALSSNAMTPAAKEISALGINFFQPYVDPEEQYKKSLEELGPPKPASSSMSEEEYESGGNQGSGVLFNACKAFVEGYKPGPVDDAKMETLVNALIAPGRTSLQGYVPKDSTGNYGGGMRDDTEVDSDYTPSAQQQSRPAGGLNFGGNNTANTRPAQPRESLDDSVRKSVAFALRQMLRDEGTKMGAKIAAAYCAFASKEEDYVPEIVLFLERSEKTLNEKDLDLLVSLPIEADYAKDPRIGFLMSQILFAVAPEQNSSSRIQIIDAFEQSSSAAPFLVNGLEQSRTLGISLIVLYNVGDGDSAVHVAKLLGDQSVESGLRTSLLEILGQTGDQRVAPAILKCLPNPEFREAAKAALIRMGTPAEATVVTIFNAKKPQFDVIALEILAKIGSWKSLSLLGRQLAFYAEAKTPAAASKMEEKPKLILESAVQNELLQKTIETGTTIVARMTGTSPPDFKNPNALKGPGMPGLGVSGDLSYDDPGSGFRPGTPRVQDGKSPRTLAKKGENPGNAPVNWMQGLAIAGSAKFDEATKILSRATNYDSGKKAGEEMWSLTWVAVYFQIAARQVNDYCLPLVESDAQKSIESSITRIENRYKKYIQERNRIGGAKNARQGFEEGFSPKMQPAGLGGIR